MMLVQPGAEQERDLIGEPYRDEEGAARAGRGRFFQYMRKRVLSSSAQGPEPLILENQLASLSRPPRSDWMMFITLAARSG